MCQKLFYIRLNDLQISFRTAGVAVAVTARKGTFGIDLRIAPSFLEQKDNIGLIFVHGVQSAQMSIKYIYKLKLK